MRVDSAAKRDWYLKETVANNWSVRNLERNINTFYFERILSSREKTKNITANNTQEKLATNDFIKGTIALSV
jgi:predicted nuclease of restriction endonuclease-like (RecB) superfamily